MRHSDFHIAKGTSDVDPPWLQIAVVLRPNPSFNWPSSDISAANVQELTVDRRALMIAIRKATTAYRYQRNNEPAHVLVGRDVLQSVTQGEAPTPPHLLHSLKIDGLTVHLVGWMEGIVVLPALTAPPEVPSYRNVFNFHSRIILEDGRHFFLDAYLPARPVEVQDLSITYLSSNQDVTLEDIGKPSENWLGVSGIGLKPDWISHEQFAGFLQPCRHAVYSSAKCRHCGEEATYQVEVTEATTQD